MARAGLIGGIAGGVLAAGTAGALALVAGQRRAVERVRAKAESEPPRYAPLPSDRTGTVTAADGVALAYEEVGPLDAPLTVVLVHGYCLTMDSWWCQRRALTARFGDDVRLVVYDQRSHGRSGRSTPADATIDQLGRDLETVLTERVPTGPVVLVGHSMGGMTVLALADRRPGLFTGGRVRGVALISTSAGNLTRLTLGLPGVLARVEAPVLSVALRVARWQADLVERGRRVGADLAWSITQRLSFDDPAVDPATVKFVNDMIAATRVEVVADFFPALMHHDKAGALATLRDVDVEVVVGDHDLMLPEGHSKAIADALPDAQLTVVAGAGHVVLLERPEAVDEVLEGLVGRALAGAAAGPGERVVGQ